MIRVTHEKDVHSSVNKKNMVIFINRVPTSRLLADAIDPVAFTAAGFRLMLLDLSPFYYPGSRADFGSGSTGYAFEPDWRISCPSPREALKVIKEHAADAWFFPLHQTYTAFADETWLYRAFRRYRCRYLVKEIDYLPLMSEYALDKDFTLFRYALNRALDHLKNVRSLRSLSAARGFLLTLLISRGLYLPGPDFCFAAGSISFGLMQRIYRGSRVVSIPSADHVKLQRLRSAAAPSPDLPLAPYIAYIDQCPFADPDHRLLGLPMMDKTTYLTRINLFFDRIERVMQKRVIIAASMKYRYEDSEFNGRQIFHGRTPELCANAEMTIAHSSTAVSLPIMLHKPILFLEVLGLPGMNHQTRCMASVLGKKALNSEAQYDRGQLTAHARVDHDRYDAYVRDYLADRPFSESIGTIIARSLREFPEAA